MIIILVAWHFAVWNTLVNYNIVMDLSQAEQKEFLLPKEYLFYNEDFKV